MFGHKKSPLRFSKHHSVDSDTPVKSRSPPHDKLDHKQALKTSGRISSDPSPFTPNVSTNPFDDDEVRGTSSSQGFHASTGRNQYKNDFRDSGGLQSQTVDDLENYAVYKAEETTTAVNGCLKLAEDMRESATNTLVVLHQQGEQITRTHAAAAEIDHDLSRGEKLLGSLGGMFSKTWKPHKNHAIAGPANMRDDPVHRKGHHLEQREKLGLTSGSKERTRATRTPPSEPTNAMEKVQVEKVKQDDALDDLSNILGELKGMAIDMGAEYDRQNVALDGAYKDVEEIDHRVQGATRRTRRLLGK